MLQIASRNTAAVCDSCQPETTVSASFRGLQGLLTIMTQKVLFFQDWWAGVRDHRTDSLLEYSQKPRIRQRTASLHSFRGYTFIINRDIASHINSSGDFSEWRFHDDSPPLVDEIRRSAPLRKIIMDENVGNRRFCYSAATPTLFLCLSRQQTKSA